MLILWDFKDQRCYSCGALRVWHVRCYSCGALKVWHVMHVGLSKCARSDQGLLALAPPDFCSFRRSCYLLYSTASFSDEVLKLIAAIFPQEYILSKRQIFPISL